MLFKPETALQKYASLRVKAKAGSLASKLAREAFFGEDVMARCTVNGFRELPALPLAELNALKQTLFTQFPEFWGSPIEFESLWSVCVDAINQACKSTRYARKKLSSFNHTS